MDSTHFSAAVRALAHAPPLEALGVATAAVLALILAVPALLVLRYTVLTAFNVFTDYFRLGRFGDLPRAKHTGTWTQSLRGDIHRILEMEPGDAHREFIKEAGSEVLLYRMLFWAPRLLLVDHGAILHILSAQQSYSFPKPHFTRRLLSRSLGDGILVVEGQKHKNQRKILQPAFNTSAVRDLMPAFFWHARRLTDRLGRTVDACTGPSDTAQCMGQTDACSKLSQKGAPVLNVNAWLNRCTLDIIGEAGFDCHFDSILKDDPDAVAKGPRKVDDMADAFQKILVPFRPNPVEIAFLVLQTQPGLGFLSKISLPFERQLDRGLATIQDLSKDIIDSKRKQLLAEMASDGKERLSKADWEDGSSATGGKDLLFLMMRSNMSHDLSESERMTDPELLGQMTTLLLAGHETTSTLLTWTLLMLARNPGVQTKLRQEMQTFIEESGRETLTYEELALLPFLDAVIKETLRMRPPVPVTTRSATHDTVIPLSQPCPTRDGKGFIEHLLVRKGEEVVIPILMINTSEKLWGPDARDFNPERWFDIPENARKSGLPLHLLSFISGPRACIGNRFALAEAKAILFTLLIQFEFSPIDEFEIEAKQAIVMRFRVKGQEDLGAQLPLRVRRVGF